MKQTSRFAESCFNLAKRGDRGGRIACVEQKTADSSCLFHFLCTCSLEWIKKMNCRHPSNLFIVLLQPVFNKRIEAGRGRTPQSYTEAHSLGTVKPGHFAEPSLNEWSNAEAGTAGSLMRQCSYRSCWLMISSPKTLSCLQKTIFFFWQERKAYSVHTPAALFGFSVKF